MAGPISIVARDQSSGRIPGHFTSMKYEFGDCTMRFSLCFFFSDSMDGLSRSTARVYLIFIENDQGSEITRVTRIASATGDSLIRTTPTIFYGF